MTNKSPAPAVDNSDWLKTAAICMVVVGHIGYFFIEDAGWWSVFGRMAAPIFFFLMGYARSRTIPFHWILLGIILTLLDSWNNDWTWIPANILISMTLIRYSRPYALILLQKYKWLAFILLISALLMVLPIAAELVDYGAEGWLWALFGLCHRMYIDGMDQYPAVPVHGRKPNWGMMRLPACIVAAVVYVWQEQLEFSFSEIQLATVVAAAGLLSLGLFVFVRGPSRYQPAEPFAGFLRFLGRHTLEIYVIQLAGSELIINLLPDLAA